jgi:prepilin-type N-terminal cleavage/methylation domain-containing protein
VEKYFMNVTQKNNQKGFTIIEVVLVLAIAALIFLMVFIALPALQRSQRDTQRKADIARVQTAIQNYQSNNRNALPTFNASFISGYMTVNGEDTFTDPNGTDYTFTANTSDDFTPSSFTAGRIYYTVGAKCNGEAAQKGQGSSKVAIQYKLEGGGTACVNN